MDEDEPPRAAEGGGDGETGEDVRRDPHGA